MFHMVPHGTFQGPEFEIHLMWPSGWVMDIQVGIPDASGTERFQGCTGGCFPRSSHRHESDCWSCPGRIYRTRQLLVCTHEEGQVRGNSKFRGQHDWEVTRVLKGQREERSSPTHERVSTTGPPEPKVESWGTEECLDTCSCCSSSQWLTVNFL